VTAVELEKISSSPAGLLSPESTQASSSVTV
jgi:hypothetical protein